MALSLEPQEIDEHNWYYEEKKGIFIVHEVIQYGNCVQADTFTIPWKNIKQSLIKAGWINNKINNW